jgi:hypothetical protein
VKKKFDSMKSQIEERDEEIKSLKKMVDENKKLEETLTTKL